MINSSRTIRNQNSQAFNVLVIFILLFISSCSQGEKPILIRHKAKKATGYELGVLKEKNMSSSVRLPGQLKPFEEVSVFARANGFVKEVYADRGSVVKKGQVLLTLEAPEMESQLEAARSKYLQAKEISLASQDKYNRLKQAAKEPGAVSRLDLDNAFSKMKGDLAIANSEQSNVASIKHMQQYLIITAPFDGVITQRNVSPGALAGSGKSGEAPLFQLQHLQKLRLEVYIPEAYVDKVDLKKQVSLLFTAIPGKTYKALISRSANALNNSTRSEAIEVDINNQDGQLKPGMFAEVEIPLLSGAKALMVPNHAIVRSTEREYVIKVEHGKALMVDVKEGLSAADSTEIFGNIKPGDQILLQGSDEIKNGATVK
nr:efflux RND transporter periplasmic adaptor subunit [Pedobacter sp. ASV19]